MQRVRNVAILIPFRGGDKDVSRPLIVSSISPTLHPLLHENILLCCYSLIWLESSKVSLLCLLFLSH